MELLIQPGVALWTVVVELQVEVTASVTALLNLGWGGGGGELGSVLLLS